MLAAKVRSAWTEHRNPWLCNVIMDLESKVVPWRRGILVRRIQDNSCITAEHRENGTRYQ
jgi:hypothetical protein